MATNFDNNALSSSGGFKPSTKDTPIDIRSRVATETDILEIPNPYVGLIIYVQDTGKRFEVLSIKDVQSGLSKVSRVDTYKEIMVGGSQEVDLDSLVAKNEIGNASQILFNDGQSFQTKLDNGSLQGPKGDQGPAGADGVTPVKGVDYFTEEDKVEMLDGYATETFVNNAIANAQLGGDGEVDLSAYATKEYVDDYTGGKKQRYITHAEYDALLDADKNDQTIVWNIVDAIDYNENNIPTDLSLDNNTLYLIDSNGNNIGDGVILNISNDNDDSQEPAELDVPRVYFYGDALPTTKDNVQLEMDYKSNTMKFHSYVKLKCQGTSSMTYAKKNFTLTMYEDSDRSVDLKKNFKGWGAQNKFCLKANWVDSTHTRNISGARIAYDMVASRPDSAFKQELLKCPRNGLVDGFPIKVYFNGEFWGIYTFNIPKDAWMFNMNEDNPNHIVLCAERNTDGNSSLINSCQFRKLWDGGGDWSYEVGTPSDVVKNSLNRCIGFVMNANDQEFHDNISQYFDLYSLLDYYCFSYVTCHLDGLAKNMLLATYDGVIWGASLYDMDSIYGVQWNGASFVSPEYKCPEQYQEQFSRLWVRIEECFADELRARYTKLRQEALSLTNIVGHVEEIYDLLSPNMKTDETTKWPNIPQYNANTITRFRNYMRDRVKYTDAEVALIGVFIDCESITLNKTELKMGIFSSEGGSTSVDDSGSSAVTTPIETTWEKGYLARNDSAVNSGSAGTVIVTDLDSTTDFITVQPGDTIQVNTNLNIGKSFGCVGYDSNQNFVAIYDVNKDGSGTWNTIGVRIDYSIKSLTVTDIPENVAYVRICVPLTPNAIDSTITSFTISRTDSTGGTKLLTYTLRATTLPTNTTDKVVWSVEPQGICTVSNGRVTAINNGDCVITATCGQQSDTCNVTVTGLPAGANLFNASCVENGAYNDETTEISNVARWGNFVYIPIEGGKKYQVSFSTNTRILCHIVGSDKNTSLGYACDTNSLVDGNTWFDVTTDVITAHVDASYIIMQLANDANYKAFIKDICVIEVE